jgi:uncharacterized protein
MEPIRFPAGDGVELEGELRRPRCHADGSAVLCHAHPRHGGSKDHPLLWAIRNDLARRGLAVLAFNFRGVMGSGGAYGGGLDEPRDVRGAVERVRREAPGGTIVVGWSFGAAVALREAIADRDVAALALIGLPVEPGDVEIPPIPDRSELDRLVIPVLVLAGARDRYAPEPTLRALAEWIPRSEVAIVSEGDHFLAGREAGAAGVVGEFAARALGLPAGEP